MTESSKRASSLPLLRRLGGTWLRPYLRDVWIALAFMLLSAAMTAGFARLVQPVMDDVLVTGNKGLLIPIALAVFACFAVRGLATYAHTTRINRIAQNVIGDIQRDLFDRMVTLDLSFHHAHPSGQLMSRLISDVWVMRNAIVDGTIGVGNSLMTLLLLLGVMMYQDWRLSLMALTIFPFASFAVSRLGRRLRKVSRSIQAETAGLSHLLIQIFQGLRNVQAYGMEQAEMGRAGEAIRKVRQLNVKSVDIGNLSTPINEILAGVGIVAIMLYGAHEIMEGRSTAGALMSFIAAFSLAYEPMKKLAKLNNSLQTGLGAAERVFEILDRQPAIQDRTGAVPLPLAQAPEIRLEGVRFQYEGADAPALDGVSVTLKAGQVTALVGSSGSGKTTLLNLIPRFYDVQQGSVLIDGHDVRSVTLASLRRHVALVSQDVTMFDDTVHANIAYGSPDATDEVVLAAARAASADQFIAALPEGYQTRLGENGVKLSGGQRQRIAIARAILRNAPILLLDEATSALDTESERAIQASLTELQKGRTTLVIAHRLSTIRDADQIVVLDRGRVVTSGRHDALMQQGGLYARLQGTDGAL